jgi:hypothetical protein
MCCTLVAIKFDIMFAARILKDRSNALILRVFLGQAGTLGSFEHIGCQRSDEHSFARVGKASHAK